MGLRKGVAQQKIKPFFIFLFFFCINLSIYAELVVNGKESDAYRYPSWSADGSVFAYASKNSVFLVDDTSLERIRTLKDHNNELIFLGFSSQTANFVSAGKDNTIIKRAITQNKPLSKYTVPSYVQLTSLAYSSEGNLIAGGLNDGKIFISNTLKLSSHEVKIFFAGHTNSVQSLAFSKDGQHLFSVSGDVIKLWNTNNFAVEKEFDHYGKAKLPVVFSPSGKSFASCTDANRISIRDFKGVVQKDIIEEKGIETFDFSSDGRFLIIADKKGALQFCSVQSGVLTDTIDSFGKSPVKAFRISNDGKKLLAICKNGKIYRISVEHFTGDKAAALATAQQTAIETAQKAAEDAAEQAIWDSVQKAAAQAAKKAQAEREALAGITKQQTEEAKAAAEKAAQQAALEAAQASAKETGSHMSIDGIAEKAVQAASEKIEVLIQQAIEKTIRQILSEEEPAAQPPAEIAAITKEEPAAQPSTETAAVTEKEPEQTAPYSAVGTAYNKKAFFHTTDGLEIRLGLNTLPKPFLLSFNTEVAYLCNSLYCALLFRRRGWF
ncbi:WD40 repeat domain-containing protein [Treponema phagedenis]|uniref:WD domain, G-beta repeat protein n=1 Tax=Treponema phagedenis TaxID=162 RepID=A0AAE6ISW6_TREPH|nr:PD40 domain-containing protein [Treponema phagedenis]QEJ94603.1 hypothetical protein FUT79_04880 [Treponema phagedenis]QEJ97611.1 hypothetical protein FUT82_06110 [Treponema phagedenis]QEK00578.1 hypothetical protein FUT84_04940 [Treponema phagedenis]QEK03178.1 hypothetical protein FUT83_04710 [Treponema phagedenis]QEK05585.1 hypothetical protein FUT80_01850 [Treponema phagedenis]